MAYVVPRIKSILFTGSNNEAVEAEVTSATYAVVESTESRIKWQVVGEMEATYTHVDAGEWLLYQDYGSGTVPVQGVSDAQYQAQYHEIT